MADEKDDLSRIADKIMAREPLNKYAMMAGVPVSGEKFNSLLADAKKLARHVIAEAERA